MAVNITVPELSESVSEATVAEWFKNVGDPVKAGDVLVTLETDKVAVEVAAESDGVLAFIAQPAGSDVKPRDVLGTLEAGSASVAAAPKTAEAAPAAPAPAASKPDFTTKQISTTPDAGETRVTPVAQRVADVHNVDVAQVPTTGGKITKADVQSYLNAQQTPPAPRATDRKSVV